MHTTGPLETVGAGVTKVLVEQLLKPVVGDATWTSGAAKLALGIGAAYALPDGSLKRMAVTGIVIDAVEDFIYGSGILGSVGGAGGSDNNMGAMVF